jgi:hypothetical protein
MEAHINSLIIFFFFFDDKLTKLSFFYVPFQINHLHQKWYIHMKVLSYDLLIQGFKL